MTCDFFSLVADNIAGLQPYNPGKSIEELEQELGIKNVIKLASNENPLGPSPQVYKSIAKERSLSRYPDSNGSALRKDLACFYHLDERQIILGDGSNELLELIARVFLTRDHQANYSKYAFAVYPLLIQAIGAKPLIIPAKQWGHDLAAMIDAITSRTRIIFVANPNNPTGTWIDAATLRGFLDRIPAHVIVVLDEAYYEYAKEKDDYFTPLPLLDVYPNLIITRTFSKAYGLAGLRVGYAFAHQDVISLLNRVRRPFNVNSLALKAAQIALTDQSHIEKSIIVNNVGMEQLSLFCDDMGFSYIPSAANFLCIKTQKPSQAVFQSLLSDGVIVRPVDNYAMPSYLRVTVGLEEENDRFIYCLKKNLSVR